MHIRFFSETDWNPMTDKVSNEMHSYLEQRGAKLCSITHVGNCGCSARFCIKMAAAFEIPALKRKKFGEQKAKKRALYNSAQA